MKIMKTNEIIRRLQSFNKWRKGEENTPPSAKNIGIAIDNAIAELEELKRTKTHIRLIESACSSSIQEIQHEKLNVEFLLSTLNEIETITEDKTLLAVIKNSKERHVLDKSIHARLLFSNDL